MNTQDKWLQLNNAHLAATIKWLVLRLQQLAQAEKDHENDTANIEAIEHARQEVAELENQTPPPALILLSEALGLSPFDQQVLSLCAAMEFNSNIGSLCAQAQGNQNKAYPSFALAFALFDDPDWSALSPQSPLRYWRLLDINQLPAQPLTGASLNADERVVNYLKGINYIDERLSPFVDSLPLYSPFNQTTHEALAASQQKNVDTIIAHIQQKNNIQNIPVIELLGHDCDSKHLIAVHVSTALNLHLQTINLDTLPKQVSEFENFTRLWRRECLLMPLALYIEVDGSNDSEKNLLKRFLKHNRDLVFLDLIESKTSFSSNRLAIEIGKPSPEEQQLLWQSKLRRDSHDKDNNQPQRLSEQFSFSQNEISRLASTYQHNSEQETTSADNKLWLACRISARSGMEQLAQRIDAKASWDQLVLPSEQKTLIRQIVHQVAQRNRVYEDWGFRLQMNRGLGINALFSGDSGTGKTMAAEVIANELELDLFRIDLSSVVSKYIGETEKNLRKLFDTAEESGAILFFDEADALFGKRSEVKDSHDRYANIEINYLLQRMESYRGLAILATNMKTSLDKAFVRRLRFIVDFPFPGIQERAEIWTKVFPPETPIDKHFDSERLAKLNLTGGNIHNVALNAAFLAAENNHPITMPIILTAAHNEYKKLERPAKNTDFAWQGELEDFVL